MIQIDDDFMREVGLGDMPAVEKAEFMRDAEEELEVRIGQKIGGALTEAQLDEFEAMNDAVMAAEWLEENAPDYREIAEGIFADFKAEIRAEQAAA